MSRLTIARPTRCSPTQRELTSLVSDDLAVLLTERFTARQPEAPPGLRPARLPVPPTAMIGRDGDREELVARLRGNARLVTVTGPGGVGKTRLALDVAAALANGTAEGVWFVDLAPAPAPNLHGRTRTS